MRHSPSPAFLQLPAEIRLAIYGHCAIPYHEPFAAYAGLYMSCLHIKQEMDSECAKVLGAYLMNIRNALDSNTILSYQVPTSFASMLKAKVSVEDHQVQLKIQGTPLNVAIKWDQVLSDVKPLLALHLQTLTLHYKVSKGWTNRHSPMLYAAEIAGWVLSTDSPVKRVVLDVHLLDDVALNDRDLVNYEGLTTRGSVATRSFKWEVKPGNRIKASWTRI